MNISEECNQSNCKKLATSSVHLELRVHRDHAPAITTPIVHLCDEHAVECTWQSLGVDNNWQAICESLEAIGKMAPVKEFSNIIIKPL